MTALSPRRAGGSSPLKGIPVPQRARLVLGHALAQRIADQAGIRILHIKGLAAEAVLPMEHSLSADVDILVDPAHHARFVEILMSLETTEVVDDARRSSEAHAIEIVSHGLGVSLDVHGHFPGFRADVRVVFERLWSDAVQVDFGGYGCACLDRVGLAVLGVVHAARNEQGSRSRNMALHRWDMLEEGEQSAALELIVDLRAQGASSTVIGRQDKASHRDIALFLAHQRRASPGTLWLLTLAATPGVRARAEVLRRAVIGRSQLAPAPEEAPAITAPPPDADPGGTRLTRGVRGVVPALVESARLMKESYRDD